MPDMAQLFADLSVAISGEYGGPYFAAQILSSTDAVIDAGGSIVTPGAPVERSCMAQVDACTEAMRSAEGYTDKDLRFLVLGATLIGAVDTDASIEMLAGPNVGTYSIQSVSRDTMGAYWELRGRRG
jgi:hypothetical protein